MRDRALGSAVVLAVCSLFILIAYAGPKDFWVAKPYTEWSAKEVEKILLKDSPWTRVLLLNAPSSGGAISSTGGGGGGRGGGGSAGGSSGGPPPIYLNWYARPIREAVVRQLMLNAPKTTKEQLDAILSHSSEFYEVMLTGHLPRGDEATAKFKEDTYLQKKDGTKIPLANLAMPRARNAASFLQFAKEVNGKPAFAPEDKEVTLVIRINDNVYKYKFKFADMMINDKPEL